MELMEEIDIIELLKRVKEGKAPKRIQIGTTNFTFTGIGPIENLYTNENGINWINSRDICMCTKIKTLDKPIINIVDELKKIIKDKDSIFWIGEKGLMAIEGAINIIQNKEEKE